MRPAFRPLAIFFLIFFLLTFLLAAGCGPFDSPPPLSPDTGGLDGEEDVGGEDDADATSQPDRVVADILFPSESFVVQLDAIRRPEAQAVNAAGEELEVRVSFESSDAAVLEISASGVAIGRAPGAVTLTARAGEVQKAWPARVATAAVATVSVVPAQYTLLVGQEVTYLALARDAGNNLLEDASAPGWASSDERVATVDAEGVARAVGVGSAEIIATIEGVEGRASVEVVDVAVASVRITPRNTSPIYPGQSLSLQARAYDLEDNEVGGVSFVWSSADAAVATVDEGVVRGVAPGRVMISASVGDLHDEVEVEVIFSVQEVFAGEGVGCAIAVEQLYCWGDGSQGQLGVGDLNDRSAPARVGYGPGIREVSLGGGHGCLINAAGELHCWGRNDYGQVGVAAGAPVEAPVRVGGTRSYVSVSAGADHSCAVDDQGGLYCWGLNEARQAGHSGASTHVFNAVGGNRTYILAAAGSRHSCGVSDANLGYCWGANDRGQLGDGTTTATPSEVPRFVDGGYTFRSLEAGEDFSCGIGVTGLPVCWGAGDRGQIGNGLNNDVNVPRTLALPVGRGLSSLSVGRDHACGLSQGEALCWGAYEDGRLGRALSADQNSPLPADFAQRFVQLDAGEGVSCGWTEALEIACWGREPGAGAVPVAVVFEEF